MASEEKVRSLREAAIAKMGKARYSAPAGDSGRLETADGFTVELHYATVALIAKEQFHIWIPRNCVCYSVEWHGRDIGMGDAQTPDEAIAGAAALIEYARETSFYVGNMDEAMAAVAEHEED